MPVGHYVKMGPAQNKAQPTPFLFHFFPTHTQISDMSTALTTGFTLPEAFPIMGVGVVALLGLNVGASPSPLNPRSSRL